MQYIDWMSYWSNMWVWTANSFALRASHQPQCQKARRHARQHTFPIDLIWLDLETKRERVTFAIWEWKRRMNHAVQTRMYQTRFMVMARLFSYQVGTIGTILWHLSLLLFCFIKMTVGKVSVYKLFQVLLMSINQPERITAFFCFLTANSFFLCPSEYLAYSVQEIKSRWNRRYVKVWQSNENDWERSLFSNPPEKSGTECRMLCCQNWFSCAIYHNCGISTSIYISSFPTQRGVKEWFFMSYLRAACLTHLSSTTTPSQCLIQKPLNMQKTCTSAYTARRQRKVKKVLDRTHVISNIARSGSALPK